MSGSEQIHRNPSGDPCPRCKQPVAFQESRCPNCGQPISGMARRLTLWIGVGGVGAILFVVLLMWLVVYNEDVVNAPVPVDQETAAKQHPIAPEGTVETSKPVEKEAAKPDKAPPLNQ